MEIGVWGDSITYGECDSEALGWVGRLRKAFPVEDYIGVYNRGICGDTSEDLVKRFAVEVNSIQPDTIIFAVGINDSKYPATKEGNKIPIEDFKKNIQTLVEEAKKYTDRIFIVGLTKVIETSIQSPSRFSNNQIELYNNVLKELSEKNTLQFINMLQAIDIKTDLYDGLHPNAKGYDKMSNTISAILLK